MDAGRLARRGRSAQRRRVAEGVAMARQLEHFPNLVAMFFARAAEKGDAPFLWAKKNGEWGSTSCREAAEPVASLPPGSQGIGLKPRDGVTTVPATRPDLCIADPALQDAGCVTVPTYTTNTKR